MAASDQKASLARPAAMLPSAPAGEIANVRRR
jgi:hypothetical protein